MPDSALMMLNSFASRGFSRVHEVDGFEPEMRSCEQTWFSGGEGGVK